MDNSFDETLRHAADRVIEHSIRFIAIRELVGSAYNIELGRVIRVVARANGP